MKKTYITPNILVRKVTPHTILAGSGENVSTNTEEKPTGNAIGWGKQGTGFDWGDSWSNNEEN